MPTYEYRCPKCGHEFEKFQRMSDDPVAECGECGASAERLLSAGGGLLFKGEGFYITDYRSSEYKKAASKESNESSGASTSSGGEGGSSSKSTSKSISESTSESTSSSGSSSTSSSSSD